jgi:hypothetical protein
MVGGQFVVVFFTGQQLVGNKLKISLPFGWGKLIFSEREDIELFEWAYCWITIFLVCFIPEKHTV